MTGCSRGVELIRLFQTPTKTQDYHGLLTLELHASSKKKKTKPNPQKKKKNHQSNLENRFLCTWNKKGRAKKWACLLEKARTRQHPQHMCYFRVTPTQESVTKKRYYSSCLKRKCIFPPSESIFNTTSDFRRQERGNGKSLWRGTYESRFVPGRHWNEKSHQQDTHRTTLLQTTGSRHLPNG